MKVVYEFSEFELDPGEHVLRRSGEPVPLTPKAFETLFLLVRNSGRVVEKNELMRALWPESCVEEGNLSQNIFVLRKILGGDQNGQSFIQTVPRRGYKFVAPVKQREVLPQVNKSLLSADYWSRRSPFRGLQAFGAEDACLFFGRDSETEDLLAGLARLPVLVVAGGSGSGKSSVVRAGVIPALRGGRFRQWGVQPDSWRVAIARPSKFPFDYLAEVLPSQLTPELSLKEQAEFIGYCRSKLPLGGEALRDAVSTLVNAAAPEPGQARILLIVDQFEEIFMLTSDKKVRERYIDALLSASRWGASVPMHLILVLRSEFCSRCLEHPGLSRCLESNGYHLPYMTGERLRESIEKRLLLAGARAETGLIDSLLNDLHAELLSLGMLEHALDQLWTKCGGFGCTLTLRAYLEIGRLRGALSVYGTRPMDDDQQVPEEKCTEKPPQMLPAS